MSNKSSNPRLKTIFAILLLTCSAAVLLYQTCLAKDQDQHQIAPTGKFLVDSPKCKIPNIDPFCQEALEFFHKENYTACKNLTLLTHITKHHNNNLAVLRIDQSAVHEYTENEISCCYSVVTRDLNADIPDEVIKSTNCTNHFSNYVFLAENEEFILVECQDMKFKKEIYRNVHATITIRNDIKMKLEERKHKIKPFSVVIVGLDSVSRLNLLRSMPKTYSFLKEHDWISLEGYNKVGDNTFPNVAAMLTGYNKSRIYELCNPTELGMLDHCSLIWYDFRRIGYITAYAEDEYHNIFNYQKAGFLEPPTDYYFRAYGLACQQYLDMPVELDDLHYCTGQEQFGERILNIAKDFVKTFKHHPKFGFFWLNSFSHNALTLPSGMDDKVLEFFKYIVQSGILDDTIFIFLSDHGMRFDDITYTQVGWLEERLPFFIIHLPDKFKQRFPLEYSNFKSNTNKLTNPYDVYMTLQHILVLSQLDYEVIQSDGCPNCKSLFARIEDRACKDVSIEQHFCTCGGYLRISSNCSLMQKAANYVIGQINEAIRKHNGTSQCVEYKLESISQSFVSNTYIEDNNTYYLLIIETVPYSVFEATLLLFSDTRTFASQGQVTRTNWYSPYVQCINDAELEKYCYCKNYTEDDYQ